MVLKEMDILVRFSTTCLTTEITLVPSCLLSCTLSECSFGKGVYSKRKEFAPEEANSFLLEKTFFRRAAKF